MSVEQKIGVFDITNRLANEAVEPGGRGEEIVNKFLLNPKTSLEELATKTPSQLLEEASILMVRAGYLEREYNRKTDPSYLYLLTEGTIARVLGNFYESLAFDKIKSDGQ